MKWLRGRRWLCSLRNAVYIVGIGIRLELDVTIEDGLLCIVEFVNEDHIVMELSERHWVLVFGSVAWTPHCSGVAGVEPVNAI